QRRPAASRAHVAVAVGDGRDREHHGTEGDDPLGARTEVAAGGAARPEHEEEHRPETQHAAAGDPRVDAHRISTPKTSEPATISGTVASSRRGTNQPRKVAP